MVPTVILLNEHLKKAAYLGHTEKVVLRHLMGERNKDRVPNNQNAKKLNIR